MKNTYTREQRRKIYLNAAGLVSGADIRIDLSKRVGSDSAYDRYVCHAVAHVASLDKDQVDDKDMFPELLAFKDPNGRYLATWLGHENDGFGPESTEGNQLRQLILLFAAELCDDLNFNEDN
jgi:hypothetical protein